MFNNLQFMNHITPIMIAFLSTYGFIVVCYKFAVSINLVDRPGYRKNHKGEVPVIGGIAIVFGFSLACLLSSRSLSEWRPLFFCMIPLVVVGVMDDHGDISVSKRVGMQVISCLVMIYHGNVRINNFGDLAGFGHDITFGGLESVITVFCVVGVINALNLIDGIDGLCASVCLVTFGGIFVLAIFLYAKYPTKNGERGFVQSWSKHGSACLFSTPLGIPENLSKIPNAKPSSNKDVNLTLLS